MDFEKFTSWVGSVQSLVVHTIAFAGSFLVAALGFAEWDTVLLLVTTIVSLEAIYLAIFIQMSVNRQSAEIHEVSEDVEEIQEDIEEISKEVDEISDDVDEIQEDVEEIQEDVEVMTGEEPVSDLAVGEAVTLDQIAARLKQALDEVERLKKGK